MKLSGDSYKDLMLELNKVHGTEIPSRVQKLMEEVGEFIEALMLRSNVKGNELIIKEGGDVLLIIFHILSIFGADHEMAFRLAADKFIDRYLVKNDSGLSIMEGLDLWFNEQEFKVLENIFGVFKSNFSDEDGYQEFVDYCHAEWKKLSFAEKLVVRQEYS